MLIRISGSSTRLAAAAAGLLLAVAAHATSATELLVAYSRQAGAAASASRGQTFFTERHGREWSCSSCHGALPVQAGRHAATGKSISAMAPAVTADRFTDDAKTEKWFRRNCNDVVGRECTAGEKADVLGWLLALKQ